MAAFNYILQITGDCQSVGVGAINLIPTGGTAPYTIEWTTPDLGEDQAVLSSYRSGLVPNTYVVRVNDSTIVTIILHLRQQILLMLYSPIYLQELTI